MGLMTVILAIHSAVELQMASCTAVAAEDT